MTHDALMAVGGLEIGMLRQELRDLRLDGLGQRVRAPLRRTSVSWSSNVPG